MYSDDFSACIELNMYFVFFSLLIWYITLIGFSYVKLILHFLDESFLIIVCYPFYIVTDIFS